MSHIVVVNNDVQNKQLLIQAFNKTSHQVTYVNEHEKVLNYLQQCDADLILLDHCSTPQVMLQLIESISQRFAIPILFLTSEKDEINAIDGLQAGADQYMIKPYSNKSLLVHIDALLRRITLEKKRLAFQHCSQQFSFKISRLPLTETEQLLVQYLSKNNGDIVSKATLQKKVLKKELSTFDRNLDVHISNIRRKMLNAGLSKLHIQTVHGKGYSFCEKVAQFSFAFLSFL
ncbi:response regulator transcription factor [Psychromonas sp. RZ22]|uniref:response regulator transcription factor n=1 Tax=Psychromonas algarum TaxID=2555643 RepID=UPI00106886F6|nr:response regulator transcription factor [Psychromonas sp. RZ22]TEW54595.1 response regulator transcription factor [Psychromonas sp. RZ22]